MKTAIILYQNDENQEVIDFLKKSFEEVFDQYITFTNVFLNRLEPGAALTADAYRVWSLTSTISPFFPRDFTSSVNITFI